MPTNFPDGVDTPYDTFQEPTAPESTSLSSGNGRNHVEHHRDLGDAVEALERNTALIGHDHSGGNGAFATAKLVQANTHESSDAPGSTSAARAFADTDKGVNSLHHTLGTSAFQAAAGDHNHDYDTLPNRPFVRCTSLTRPANPAPGTWIWETDTNRARVWAQFTQNNIANAGLNATDDFERVSSLNMGTSLWSQTYTIAGTHGVMATPDGHAVSWTDQGTSPGRCIARRTNASDAVTTTDNQVITWQTAGQAIEYHLPWITTSASNDMYFRMSADGQSYLRLAFTFNEWAQGYVTLYATKTGPAHEQQIGSLAADTRQAWTRWTAELVGRTVSVYCESTFIGKIVDSNSVSNLGASYRGWGVGMSAGDHLIVGQTSPSSIASVNVRDATYYTGTSIWQLLPVGATPSLQLRQTTAQQLYHNGTAVQWSTALEDNFGMWNPAGDRAQVSMKEAGLYQIDAAIQWNPSVVPEVATAGIAKNGANTTIQQSAFMKSNLFGVSQTLNLSGKLRVAQNDALTLTVSYKATGNLIDNIFSFVDGTSQVNSRLDIAYLGP